MYSNYKINDSYICSKLIPIIKFTEYGARLLFGFNPMRDEFVAISEFEFDGFATYKGKEIFYSDNPNIVHKKYISIQEEYMLKVISRWNIRNNRNKWTGIPERIKE